MGSNFFLDGRYTQQQINSLNKIKSKANKAAQNSKNVIQGDSNSIFKDINTKKSNPKAETNNSGLFDYIDKMAGLNDFFSLMDADGDGKISEAEAGKLAGLNGDNKLTSEDIDAFIKEVKNLNNATSITTSGNTTTEAEYKTDSKGQLVKNTQVSKDAKTGEITAEYTLNEKGDILTKNDKTTDRTTTFKYSSNGKLESSETVANDSAKTKIAESKYDEQGRKTETKLYFDNQTGKKVNQSFKYEYDENGKIKTQKWINNDTNKTLADLTFIYDKNGKFTGYTNSVNNSTKTFTYGDNGLYKSAKITKTVNGKEVVIRSESYDENGKLKEIIKNDDTGKLESITKVNKNGTFASRTEGNETTVYKYAKGGIREKDSKYNATDIDETGNPKSGAKALEETEYKNGIKIKTTSKDGYVTEFDEEGNKTKETTKDGTIFYKGGKPKIEIKGGYAFVYEYDSSGNQTKAVKYKASDIDKNGNVKSGATPISTDKTEETNKTDKTNTDNKTDTEKSTNENDTSDKINDLGKAIIDAAKKLLGSTKYAGQCSHFAKTMCKNSGVPLADWFKKVHAKAIKILPAAQKANAVVSASEARPGDLIVYTRNGKPYHTEILYKINSDGSILTISGDRDKVRIRSDRGNKNNSRYNYIRVTA